MKRTVLFRERGEWSQVERNAVIIRMATSVLVPSVKPQYMSILGEINEVVIRQVLNGLTQDPFTVAVYEESSVDYPLRDL